MMAVRGANYRQILAKYFPSTSVETQSAMVRSRETEIEHVSTAPSADGVSFLVMGDDLLLRERDEVTALPPRSAERLRLSVELPKFFRRGSASPASPSLIENGRQSLYAAGCGQAAESFSQPRTFADALWNHVTRFENRSDSRFIPATTRRTLRSEDFHISYPDNISQLEIERLMSFLQSSRRSLIGRAEALGITVRFPSLEIFINETTGNFVGRTGQPSWAAAATKGSRIELQPLETLKRRRVLETTLRHELVHTLIDVLSHGRAPRWLAEGFALHLAGEGHLVARYAPRTRMTTEEIEQKLDAVKSANDMRLAYAAAYAEVKRLIQNEGELSVWRRVAQ